MDGGKPNHGNWIRVEGKQVSIFSKQGGIKVTESSRCKFSFIDLKIEEVQWLKTKFKIAKKGGWRWNDSSMVTGTDRLFAWDMTNEEGMYLCLKLLGRKKNLSIFIPFGKGGWGWESMARLLHEAKSLQQVIIKPTTKKEESQQMWEEVLVVARNHNSKLFWRISTYSQNSFLHFARMC